MQEQSSSLRLWFIAICIAIATTACYWNVKSFDFVNFDDLEYIVYNSSVQQPINLHSIGWAFTTLKMANWHPVTWVSYIVDFNIFGLNPGGYHATNVAIHIFNSILLVLVLFHVTRRLPQAALIGILFALHPLHVESVAWISERKDVLSALFLILCFGAYSEYARSLKVNWYLVSLLLFATGLMAKPMLVTVPFMLLLFDFWPFTRVSLKEDASSPLFEFVAAYFRRGNRKLWIEKIPFFILSGISSVLTIIAQHQYGAISSVAKLSFLGRILNAIQSYLIYLLKTITPYNLSVFYPYPRYLSILFAALALLVLLGITYASLRAVRRYPYLIVGWLIFVGSLVPVAGIFQVGSQAYADRYMYVPHIGLFIAVVFFLAEIGSVNRWLKAAVITIAAFFIAYFAVVTQRQVQVWKNNVSLYMHSLAVTENNRVAHHNLSAHYIMTGEYQKAMYHAREVVRLEPNSPSTIHNIALSYEKLNMPDSALALYQKVLKMNPQHTKTFSRIASMYLEKGRQDLALKYYLKAVEAEPDLARNWNNLGSYYLRIERMDSALDCYIKSIQLDPSQSLAYSNMALFFIGIQEYSKAERFLDRSLANTPNDPIANIYKGDMYVMRGSVDSALACYGKSLASRPLDPELHRRIATTLNRGDLKRPGITQYHHSTE